MLGPVPSGVYSGSAPLQPGQALVDNCDQFATPGLPFLMDSPDGLGQVAGETIYWNELQQGFNLWAGQSANVWFRFMLEGVEQHSSGWLSLANPGPTHFAWDGSFNELQVWGVQVVMLNTLDEVPFTSFLDEPGADYQGVYDDDPTLRIGATDVVPEPATLTLMATGLMGLAAARRRRERDFTLQM
jgi:hypothetical protein